METIDGRKCYHFTMTSRTYEFVDIFYKVRDYIEGFADESMTIPSFTRKHRTAKESEESP